jgi:sugar phosphate isomerase/epimerase
MLAFAGDAHSTADNMDSVNPVFAFCHDTHDTQKRDFTQQAVMLRELGFDGAGHIGSDDVPARLATLASQDLRLFLIGVRLDLANPKEPYPPSLATALQAIKNKGVVLYVTIAGYPASSPEGNDQAVRVLRKVNRLADDCGVRVALYPHTGDWLVRVEHAAELVRRVDDDNLGVIFNLCHWMKNEDVSQLEPLLDQIVPHLFVATINGADTAGIADSNWNRLIQPLDCGDYDVKRVLQLLRDREFKGPVGIMCYGIAEDAKQHLSRSMEMWRRWHEP